MPLASLSAGAAALLGTALSGIGGATSAAISSRNKNKEIQAQKDLETINQTNPGVSGYDGFGVGLSDNLKKIEGPKISLQNPNALNIFNPKSELEDVLKKKNNYFG